LYVLAWIFCFLLVIVDILAVRETTLDILTAVQVNRIANAPEAQANLQRIRFGFSIQAIDQGFLFVGGIVAVIFALGIEYYFWTGRKKGKLLPRIGRVAGIEVAVFVVCVVTILLV
jgi:hypothetical protein